MWFAVAAAGFAITGGALWKYSQVVLALLCFLLTGLMVFFLVRQWWISRHQFAFGENAAINKSNQASSNTWFQRIRNAG